MKQAKDFLKNPINVGDKVVFADLYNRNLNKGKVVKITDKMVFIEEDGMDYKETYGGGKPFFKPTKQFHNQVIKIK